MRIHRTIRTALAFVALVAATGQAADDAAIEKALSEGAELFHEASNTDDPEEAQELYRRALHRYEFAVYEGDVANGELFYNIANAYYRLDRLGEAMLYYRRADLLRPGDPNIEHNLSQIRSERQDVLPPPHSSGVARSFLFWHVSLSSQQKAIALTIALSAGFVTAGLYVLRRERWRIVTAIVAGAVGLLFLGSIGVDALGLRGRDEGVITESEVTARKGDGTAYEPAFVDPLHAGAEFTLIERRGSWLRVRLTDGQTAWVPREDVTMIRPLTDEQP
jgi:hypothetical protein